MAISVVVAVDPIGDDLLDRIKTRVSRLRVGPGTDERAEMGPLITGPHRDRVASYLDTGVREGATLPVDGRAHPVIGAVKEEGQAGEGFWLGPSVLDHVTPSMSCYQDEIFGPVLSVTRVPSFDQALDLVNDNPYGNGTALFTTQGSLARRYQSEVEVGMVGINVPIPVPAAAAAYSFGGWKSSLFGDAHAYGPEGLQFFTRGKVVTSKWPHAATPRTQPNLNFPGHE